LPIGKAPEAFKKAASSAVRLFDEFPMKLRQPPDADANVIRRMHAIDIMLKEYFSPEKARRETSCMIVSTTETPGT